MDKQLQQAVIFFKSEQAYKKLFSQFKKKYESLGRIGGTVTAGKFTDEELGVIGGFFGMPVERLRDRGSISMAAFERQLEDTRFGDIALKQLLDAYFDENLISKKQRRLDKEENIRGLLLSTKERYTDLAFWCDYLLGSIGEARWIWTLVEKEPVLFEKMVDSVAEAYHGLPEQPERLPMFSQRITGDPHAFDLHTELGKLFLHVLAVNRGIKIPSSTEAINELLQVYNIYRDDLLNFVTCAGLYAERDDGMHPVWKAAVEENTVKIVPLRELVGLGKVYPASGTDVWLVENSGVCATLLDYKPNAPIVCTNGQFTLAALLLLDKLVGVGSVLHYAGDFDPEGLGMAQRLLERYPGGQVQLWHMDLDSYLRSNPVKELTQERLEKLNRIEHVELQDVVAEMRNKEKAGYQEALVEWMVEDIR